MNHDDNAKRPVPVKQRLRKIIAGIGLKSLTGFEEGDSIFASGIVDGHAVSNRTLCVKIDDAIREIKSRYKSASSGGKLSLADSQVEDGRLYLNSDDKGELEIS